MDNQTGNTIADRTPGRRARKRAVPAALLFALALLAASGGLAGERPADVPAGQEQTALIELDGTASESPDGGTLIYQWRQIEGPKVELSDPAAPKPYFRTGKAGFYRFELVVTANGLRSEPFFVDLEIERQNLPPVAVVPEEVFGEAGKPLEIDARDSYDPEGENVTYRWRSLNRLLEIPFEAMNKPVLSFQPNIDGVFEVELVVSDGEAVSPPSVIRVAIKPKPRPPIAKGTIVALKVPTIPQSEQAMAAPAGTRPVANINGPTIAKIGDPVMLDARGSRSASGTARLEYLWRQKSGPFISDFELVFDGAAERFQPPKLGDYEFELVVSDGSRESLPVLHTVRIVKDPDPPVAVVVAPSRAMPGALVRMDATQSYDLEGSPLVYRWRQTGGPKVTNYVIDEKTGDAAPAFHPPAAGIYSFELVVSNGKLQSKPIEIDIEVGDARRPPKLTMGGPEVANAGDRLELTVRADQPNLNFVWRQMEGPGQALATPASGSMARIMPPLPGRYVFDVSALENGKVAASARRTLEVFAPARQTASGGSRPLPADAPQPIRPPATPQAAPAAAAPTPIQPLTPLVDMPASNASAYPPLPAEPPRQARAAAQIHPSSLSGGLYTFTTPPEPEPPHPLSDMR